MSDAQVSEVEFTAFVGTRYEITGWLVVRRVLDANTQDPLFPVWRYHPRRGKVILPARPENLYQHLTFR